MAISLVLSSLMERRALIDSSNGGGGTGMRIRDNLLFQNVIV